MSVDRRPVKQRQSQWAPAAARWLIGLGLQPNQISIASVAVSAIAAVCLLLATHSTSFVQSVLLFLAAGALIELRLICNLLDGLMAVEGGLKSRSGEIFNELPDRFSDAIVLVAAGYTVTWVPWGQALGWAAGLLAVLTAYVRALGGAAGASQQFCGPMAKQQRMQTLVLACVIAPIEWSMGWSGRIMTAALGVIILGCLVTIARRTRRIVAELEAR